MKIDIGNYVVESDGMCIILKVNKTIKKGDRAGEAYEQIVGYYSMLEHALHRLIDEKLAEDERQSVDGLLLKMESIKQEILTALKDGNLKNWGRDD